MGKLFLIEASVGGDYTWLGVMIVIGSMISLAYYLRVIAAVWMRPAPRLVPGDRRRRRRRPTSSSRRAARTRRRPAARSAAARAAAAAGSCSARCSIAAAATIVFGIAPDPLVDFAENAGESIAATLGV